MNDIVFAGRPQERGEHRHKGWEIICPSSPAVYGAQGVQLKCGSGEAAVIPRRVAHVNDGAELSVVIENALIAPLSPCIISGAAARDIIYACGRVSEYFADGAGRNALVLDGFGGLIVALIGAYCRGNFSPAVKCVLDDIEKGVSDPMFSLENCIRGVPLNYDYVRKLFRREVGQTPLEYLTARRMSLARELLLSGVTNRYSNYTVSQVAEMCGYAEALYFSRVFKKYYGVPPKDYAASVAKNGK